MQDLSLKCFSRLGIGIKMIRYKKLTSLEIAYWPTFVVIALLLIAPLLIDTVPPLLDYPIHLARSYIYNAYNKDAVLPLMFEIDWRPLPNLGSDIALMGLTSFLDVEDAGRVLLATIIILTLIGPIFLHRIIFSDWGWQPFAAGILAYHGALTAGFLNFSLGLSLIPFALGVYFLSRDNNVYISMAVNCLSALILYFCHIIALAIFGLLLLGCHIFHGPEDNGQKFHINRNIFSYIILSIPFILPFILYVYYSFYKAINNEGSVLMGQWSIAHKLRGFLMPVLSGNYLIDLISLVFISILLFSYFISKKTVIHKGLLLGCFMVFMAFVMLPSHMLSAAFIMDRLLIAVALILVASAKSYTRDKSRVLALIAPTLALLTLRAWCLADAWQESDKFYRRLSSALEIIESGASVMIASPFTRLENKSLSFWHQMRLEAPNWHFALLNIPTLHAMPVIPLTKNQAFTQLHFVWPDKQVLSLSHEFAHLDYGDGGASTWHPNEIFLCVPDTSTKAAQSTQESTSQDLDRQSGLIVEGCVGSDDSSLTLADHVREFDYILLLYANYLLPSFRARIDRRFGLHSEHEFMLLKVITDRSWRMKKMESNNIQPVQ